MLRYLSLGLIVSFALHAAPAARAAQEDDEKAIRESAKKYEEAYNRHDVETLASQYAPDADYDEGTGEVIKGRDAIRKKIDQDFADEPDTKMKIEIKSIRFAKTRAIETGVAMMTAKGGESTEVPYRAVHAKQSDGKWLMSSVGPDVTAENASAGPLEPLEWMIGSWKDDEEGVDVKCTCSWTVNRRFILRSFVISTGDDDSAALKVSEVVGWDAADSVIRSWVFDSDGGTGTNTWRKRGDDWVILAKGILADGGRGSAVNLVHQIDKDSFTWSSTNRDVDGEMLPDVENIKMVRVPDSQPADAAASEGGKP